MPSAIKLLSLSTLLVAPFVSAKDFVITLKEVDAKDKAYFDRNKFILGFGEEIQHAGETGKPDLVVGFPNNQVTPDNYESLFFAMKRTKEAISKGTHKYLFQPRYGSKNSRVGFRYRLVPGSGEPWNEHQDILSVDYKEHMEDNLVWEGSGRLKFDISGYHARVRACVRTGEYPDQDDASTHNPFAKSALHISQAGQLSTSDSLESTLDHTQDAKEAAASSGLDEDKMWDGEPVFIVLAEGNGHMTHGNLWSCRKVKLVMHQMEEKPPAEEDKPASTAKEGDKEE